MPEGDTIHRLANVIRPELIDHTLTEVTLREQGSLAALTDQRVKRVEAHGKHLLISVESGWSLRMHLGMYGDMHRYQLGERWKRSRTDAVLVLSTDDDVVFAWFEPAQAELCPTKMLRIHPLLSRLGPDLLAFEVDFTEVVKRAMACAHVRGLTYGIGELLLDQSVSCGIGNIYKNELLFIEGLSPWTPAVAVTEDTFLGIYQRARRLLKQNLKPGKRSTRRRIGRSGTFLRREPKLWVYGREGRPCLRCGAVIRMVPQGAQPRVTFFCPQCQPLPESISRLRLGPGARRAMAWMDPRGIDSEHSGR